jgi:CysZ protein
MSSQPEPNTIQQVVTAPVGLVAGATYPLQALVFLFNTPKLWGSVIFPILLNGVVGAALYVGLLLPGWEVVNRWSSGLPSWMNQWVTTLPEQVNRWLLWLPATATFIDDVLRWLLAIVLLVTIGVLIVQFGAILGAPWYGNLAEQTERLRLGQLPEAKLSFGRAIQDIGRAIGFQAKKLFLMVGSGILFLGVGLVPGMTPIVSLGWIALGSILVCLDFLDPPLERRRFKFRQKLAWLGRTFPASASFGWVCLILVSIPLLNLLVVPLCVIAGTLFCCDRILPYANNA